MSNEFNVAKVIEDTIKLLVASGISAEDGKRLATEQVNSMGVTKTLTGNCPLGGANPMACMFCNYGHMTECHHPLTCEEANCSHYQAESAKEV